MKKILKKINLNSFEKNILFFQVISFFILFFLGLSLSIVENNYVWVSTILIGYVVVFINTLITFKTGSFLISPDILNNSYATKKFFRWTWIFSLLLRLLIYLGIIILVVIFNNKIFNVYALFLVFSIPWISTILSSIFSKNWVEQKQGEIN